MSDSGSHELRYEAHITFQLTYSTALQEFAKADNGWTYSCIDGDPLLGAGLRCYLTGHDDDRDALLMRMIKVCGTLRIPFTRMKIEETVFDTGAVL